MIKQIKIKGLFGRFDYDIVLKDGGITILTGPNGFGKSTIIKLIYLLSNKDIDSLLEIPYSKIEIIYDSAKTFTIDKSNEIKINGKLLDKIDKNDNDNIGNNRIDNMLNKVNYDKCIMNDLSEKNINELLLNQWFNNESFSYNNLIASKKKNKQLYNDIEIASQELGKIKLIKEQRLLDLKDRKYTLKSDANDLLYYKVINKIPIYMKQTIDNVLKKYLNVSSDLDSSYPIRLLKLKNGINEEKYYNNLIDVINVYKKLINYKLFEDQKIFYDLEYKPHQAQLLGLYFDDLRKKYEVFNDLLIKLDLFTSIINDKLKFTKINITREQGMELIDKDNEKKLDFNMLSSGEQQLIVIFYELIFNTEEKTLLMIDEPEISLHVAWQIDFLDDIKRIINSSNKNFNIVIATHSPQIIGNNWDIQIDLGEQYGEQFS